MALVTGIDATGVVVRAATSAPWASVVIQNVGTVAVSLYKNATGSGDPWTVLPGGSATDDGTGGVATFDDYLGAIFAKSTGAGRLLAS